MTLGLEAFPYHARPLLTPSRFRGGLSCNREWGKLDLLGRRRECRIAFGIVLMAIGGVFRAHPYHPDSSCLKWTADLCA
jgi:hypothetical protein